MWTWQDNIEFGIKKTTCYKQNVYWLYIKWLEL